MFRDKCDGINPSMEDFPSACVRWTIKDNCDKVQETQNQHKLLFCNKINTTHEAEDLLGQFLLKCSIFKSCHSGKQA